ncbi:MAG: primosomal protein N' [Deltaproteobacteria bacterium]|nr:primosomal protein N' [Deltaproteobacteria bacterium]MBW2662809.1 primosomal protein N' [Deltaproteobacteria bacterium]
MEYSEYIQVAVAIPVHNAFTYRVPKHLSSFVSIGKRVLVPFGKRRVTGYILGSSEPVNDKKIKCILDVLDEKPLFPSSMIPFFKWIADYYIYPVGQVIKNALPGGLNLYELTTVAITEMGEKALLDDSVTPLQKEILSCLKQGSCQRKMVSKKLNKKIPNSLISAMEDLGLIIKKQELKGGETSSKKERYVSLIRHDMPAGRLSAQREKIIDAIKNEGEISVKKLKELVPAAPRLIKSMEVAGQIKIFTKKVYRDPFGELIKSDTAHILTDEQDKAIFKVVNCLGKGFAACLLTGVTGSGKTEVYMQLAAEALKRGISVLVLVSEIALISQIERRFRARFGENVALLHSRLSAGQRYDQWMRIVNKEVNIAIGARSCIFAPLADVGLIIVDEEHDTSYKQESGLRYNARDLAVIRAKLNGGVALLGSATPSIQSYYNVTTKKYVEAALTKRVENRPLPEITVVDLRKNRDARGIRHFITSELYTAIKETLDHDEQVLLFLNRRGYASFPVCAACGKAVKCKNCDITLTLHRGDNAYKCHYCGYSLASVSNCSTCGSSRIKQLGLGTEKVEAAVKALFPDANVARMDRDTTTRKGSMLKILKGLRDRNIDILIGTQMAAKGHDFPNITLVGIICADLSLSFPDFRAGERTFQLLAQVSGRAGRGEVPGRVVLQTYNPDHYSILSARKQDFKTFYNEEIGFRKALNYPPFSRIIQLKISGRNSRQTGQYAQTVGDLCNVLKKNDRSFMKFIEILGPIEASLYRIAKQYRWQILLKSKSARLLHSFVHKLIFENQAKINNRHVKLVVDVDPFFML